MSYLVYRPSSLRIVARCKTLAGAKRSAQAAAKRAPEYSDDFAWGSQEKYDALDVLVDTYNMLDPERKPLKIRLSQKGGCCDPATESYHCM